MISSPCKACDKKNLPKDQCIDTCQLIQRLQGMHLSPRDGDVGTASFDHTEEGRLHPVYHKIKALNLC
jgi:hypothetical protein